MVQAENYTQYKMFQNFWKNYIPTKSGLRKLENINLETNPDELALKLYNANKVPIITRLFSCILGKDKLDDIGSANLLYYGLTHDRARCSKYLVPLLKSSDQRIRIGAIIALRYMGDESAIDHVIPFTSLDSWEAKYEALYTLTNIGDERCLEVFKRIIDEHKSHKHKGIVFTARKCYSALKIKLRYINNTGDTKVAIG